MSLCSSDIDISIAIWHHSFMTRKKQDTIDTTSLKPDDLFFQ